jgi:hypothetical protein
MMLIYMKSTDFPITGISIRFDENFLIRKSSGGHQAKRRKEEKTSARGTGRHAIAYVLIKG